MNKIIALILVSLFTGHLITCVQAEERTETIAKEFKHQGRNYQILTVTSSFDNHNYLNQVILRGNGKDVIISEHISQVYEAAITTSGGFHSYYYSVLGTKGNPKAVIGALRNQFVYYTDDGVGLVGDHGAILILSLKNKQPQPKIILNQDIATKTLLKTCHYVLPPTNWFTLSYGSIDDGGREDFHKEKTITATWNSGPYGKSAKFKYYADYDMVTLTNCP
jgi:hypothetical protein